MKGVLLHAALACLGLLAAYRTWTRPLVEEEKPSDEVVLLECDPSKLESIDLEVQTHKVHIEPERAQKDGLVRWVTVTRKPPEPPPDAPKSEPKTDGPTKAGADAKEGAKASDPKSAPSPAVDPAVKPPEATPALPEKKPAREHDPEAPVTFRANAKLDELLTVLLPVRALRSLGKIPKQDYAQFGFDSIKTHLEVACGGKRVALDFGARTFGNQDQYARDPKTDQSYLMPGRIVTELQASQYKFTQNELHTFTLADVDAVVISAEGKQRRLLHRDRLDKERAQWVDAAAPDRRNELFGNWFDRLARVRVRGYLPKDGKPGSDLQVPASEPVPVVTIEHELPDKKRGKLELVRVDAGDESFFYARSETTRRWVSVFDSAAKQVADDVTLVVSGEESASDVEMSEPSTEPSTPAAH